MKRIKLLTLIVFMIFSFHSFSQIGVTSYSLYAIGINTSQNNRISGELKTYTNRLYDNIVLELDGFYNFKPGKYHRFSVGVGVGAYPFAEFDPIHKISFPVALEFYPLQDFKRFSVLFEVAPEYVVEDNINLRGLWGIRYTFGKEKDE
jgi:hypothetical protein